MKYFLVLLSALVLLWACNDEIAGLDTKTDLQKDHLQNELQLNEGKKWTADESTKNNVHLLEQVIKNNQPGSDTTLGPYKIVAEELQAGLDKLVSECRMKGADHDALHVWLEPLMAKVKNLKQTENKKEAVSIYTDVAGEIQIFNQIFE